MSEESMNQQNSDLMDILCHCHPRRMSTSGYHHDGEGHLTVTTVPRIRQVSGHQELTDPNTSSFDTSSLTRIKVKSDSSPDERAIKASISDNEEGWSLSDDDYEDAEDDEDNKSLRSDTSHFSKWKNYKPPADMREMEEQFKKALMSNAQLDNEKQVYVYQIEAMKDDLTEMEEEHVKVVRDMKEKTRALDLLKRDFNDLQEEYRMLQEVLSQRDKLITDHGLVVVNFDGEGEDVEDNNQRINGNGGENGDENCNGTETGTESVTKSTRSSRSRSASVQPSSSASVASSKDLGTSKDVSSLFNGPCLISREIINLLESFEGSTLEAKMKCMAEEREDLILEVQRLRLELEDERARNETLSVISDHRPPTGFLHSLGTTNGIGTPSNIEGSTCGSISGDNEYDMKKLLHDYKFQLKKAEQEIALLQGNNTRLEAQLKRANDSIKEAEELEDKLKTEKRKILRELRETQTKVEELELANDGLKKKVDKLKETRLDRIISSNSNPVGKETPPKE